MSHQRRRGQPVVIYPEKLIEDRRGNHQLVVDMDNPITTKAVTIPQRSAKAEVPGQAVIDVTRLIVAADLGEVGLLSKVDWKGEQWDVVTPPAYHHGTRHTRHWTIDIRRRP